MEIKKIAIFGTGAIGSAFGSKIAQIFPETYFVSRDSKLRAIEENGIQSYQFNGTDELMREESLVTLQNVKIIRDFKELSEMDVIFLPIKNYSLENVCEILKPVISDNTLIVSIANGVKNRELMPKYFKKVIYAVANFNSWIDLDLIDSDNQFRVGYQKKAPLLIGTYDNSLQQEMEQLTSILGTKDEHGWPITIVRDLDDTVHHKLILNLTNIVETLIGFGLPNFKLNKYNIKLFQKILGQVLFEGIKVMKAAGHKPVKHGLVSWGLIKLNAKAPQFITLPIFKQEIKAMQISSTSQDVFKYKRSQTELESLTGYLIQLADQYNVQVPYNKTVYNLSKAQIKPEFHPFTLEELFREIQKNEEQTEMR